MRVASRHNFEAFNGAPDAGIEKSRDRIGRQPFLQFRGPRRLTLLPIDASAFASLPSEDVLWLSQQEARFASDSEGLATKPNFALISFEAMNVMNGQRGTDEIASFLATEFLIDIDKAWVNRLVSILVKQHLVTLENGMSP